MNDAQLLHVLEATHQLDSESSDKTFLETCIVIHLDEFVEVETEQVKCHAEVVSEHKVVLNLYNAFFIFDIIFLN
jgi:hypothetical protein